MMEVVEVSDAQIASGRIDGIIPKYDEIPKEYKDMCPKDQKIAKMHKFMETWFFCGVGNVKFIPKEGIDKDKAFRMVSCVIRSWEPSHEHKEAAVTYMLCEFFDDIEFEVKKRKE